MAYYYPTMLFVLWFVEPCGVAKQTRQQNATIGAANSTKNANHHNHHRTMHDILAIWQSSLLWAR